MKDQLIKFKTAKLAKEKGFDWKILSYYNQESSCYDNNTLIWTANLERGVDIDDFYIDCNNLKESEMMENLNIISAPTQALLQKWIREKHNIHVLMNVGMNDGVRQTFYCNVCLFGKNLYKSKFRSKTSIYTYEEALEIGLLEALKLI